jgi:hypothetical protein
MCWSALQPSSKRKQDTINLKLQVVIISKIFIQIKSVHFKNFGNFDQKHQHWETSCLVNFPPRDPLQSFPLSFRVLEVNNYLLITIFTSLIPYLRELSQENYLKCSKCIM